MFVLPRVAELLIHEEKQRGCPLLEANKHPHTLNINVYVYISNEAVEALIFVNNLFKIRIFI